MIYHTGTSIKREINECIKIKTKSFFPENNDYFFIIITFIRLNVSLFTNLL